MADISNELNNIMSARYGEEVRGSIHDGIQKINNELETSESTTESTLSAFSGRVGDVEDRQDTLEDELQEIIHSGDNPIAELINARGTYSTLGNRLDANDTIVNAIDSEVESARNGQANLGTRLTNIETTATNNLANVFKLGTRNGTQNVQNNSGTINITSSSDIDKLLYTGTYTYTGNYSTLYTNSYVNFIEVQAKSSSQAIQTWYQLTTNRKWVRYYNFSWSNWTEIIPNKTISTTETFTGDYVNGKEIYCKYVSMSYSQFTSNSQSIAHGISGLKRVIDLKGGFTDSSNGSPRFRRFPSIYYADTGGWGIQVMVDPTYLIFEIGNNALARIRMNSTTDIYAIVYYTKA